VSTSYSKKKLFDMLYGKEGAGTEGYLINFPGAGTKAAEN
jgi:hypothetical protein